MKRVFLIVIDGLGVGAQEDAYHYGDEGVNTLRSALCAADGILENFSKLGLGNLFHETKEPTRSDLAKALPGTAQPLSSTGRMREVSAGKDSTTGHWELAGIQLDQPFPTYPKGFPESLIRDFCNSTGAEGVLCNKPYSGTDVIRDFGAEHQQTGKPIVYTSADSVFQIAAHTETVPLEALYEWCRITRERVCTGRHEVGRVIARPFKGSPGNYRRISESRKDYSSIPPQPNLLSELQDHSIYTCSIGKVADLFAGMGFQESKKTESNRDGLHEILEALERSTPCETGAFIFANLIDTDQLYGHRQDPLGFFHCLMEIDRAIPELVDKLQPEDLLILTGDHGNDPDDNSTDHTREFVPLLVLSGEPGMKTKKLGTRSTFSDVSASILEWFGLNNKLPGDSFL